MTTLYKFAAYMATRDEKHAAAEAARRGCSYAFLPWDGRFYAAELLQLDPAEFTNITTPTADNLSRPSSNTGAIGAYCHHIH